MIKKKIKIKSKFKTKMKVKIKKVSSKIKNPVYLDSNDLLIKLYKKKNYLDYLMNKFVSIHSNSEIVHGLLLNKKAGQKLSLHTVKPTERKNLDYLNTVIYTLKTNGDQMPNRDDLSLIAENDDYLGNELFWNEHDEFKKDSFKKSTDYQFTLGNVDKVDVENNRIYVRRLKQVKNK